MDSQRPQVPEEFVSLDGWSLIWIDAILLVPAIFGVMFLPATARLLIVGAALAFAAACGVLYSWARKRGFIAP